MNKMAGFEQSKINILQEMEDQIRILAINEDRSEFKQKLLSLRNQMSDLLDEMEYEANKT